MRKIVRFDADVAAALKRHCRQTGKGLHETVNQLIRAGLRARPRQSKRFRQRSSPLGLRIDVTNVAEAVGFLEGPLAR